MYEDKIVKALLPAAEWIKHAPAGFLIPIAILIILSIPPVSCLPQHTRGSTNSFCQLFGAEIIHLLCGFTYGLGPGFLIVCGLSLSPSYYLTTYSYMHTAGTAIGESITFYAFRTILHSRAQKLERGEGAPRWAALARVIREGGFWAALVVRFSAIPTHSKSTTPQEKSWRLICWRCV